MNEPVIPMPNRPCVVLLIGKPGHGRDALAGLISALPGEKSLVCADTGLLALKSAREIKPCLALIAGGLPYLEVIELVRQFKLNWPVLPCLVLAERSEQQRDALLAGADYVMPQGMPSSQLLPVVQQMLELRS